MTPVRKYRLKSGQTPFFTQG